MRRALLVVLAAVAATTLAACLVSIDESRIDDSTARPPSTRRDSGAKADTGKGSADEDEEEEAPIVVPPGRDEDGGLTCESGRLLCGEGCVEAERDPERCGGCTTRCGPAQVCTAGKCVAPSSCQAVLARGNTETKSYPLTVGGTETSAFCVMENGEAWTMMLRLNAGGTGDPAVIFSQAQATGGDAQATSAGSRAHYVSPLLARWDELGFKRARARIVDENNTPVKELVFDAAQSAGTFSRAEFFSWKFLDKTQAQSQWNLTGIKTEWVRPNGDETTLNFQRRFLFSREYGAGGCVEDTGWLIVHGTPGDAPCKTTADPIRTDWEYPFDKIRILYAPGKDPQKWSQKSFALAAGFAILAR